MWSEELNDMHLYSEIIEPANITYLISGHSQFEGKNSRAEKTTALLEKQSSRVGEDSTTIGVERRNSRTGVDAPRTETGSSYLSERRQSRELLGNYGKQVGSSSNAYRLLFLF